MAQSSSSLGKFFECPQLYEFTYRHKLEPISGDSGFEAAYGRAFHGLVEGDHTDFNNFGNKWQGVLTAHKAAYDNHWKGKEFNYIAQELAFTHEIAPGYVVKGRLDGIIERDGLYYVAETKTTGKYADEYVEQYMHRLQFPLYVLSAKAVAGVQIEGIVVDVTRRCSLRQSSSETDEDYTKRCAAWWKREGDRAFARSVIRYTDEQLHDAAADIMQTIDLINTNTFPKNRNSCYNWRRQCGFYDACFNGEPLSSELYQVRKKR